MLRAPYLAVPPAITPKWRVTAGGAAVALDLDDVKIFIDRPVEDTAWDAETTRFISIAQKAIERRCELRLTPVTLRCDLPMFLDRIRITARPFVSVTSIAYVDAESGEILTVPSSTYHVLPIAQDCGMISLGDGLSWPVCANRQDAVRITCKAGFALTEQDKTDGHPEMPEDVAHAIMMTTAALDMAKGETQGSGGNVTVYAMKATRGGGLIPAEAMQLLAPFTYRHVGAA